MNHESFFDEQKEQSQIKAEIVAKYFGAWANVIIPSAQKGSNKIGYIDLFAGPGRYRDGAKSTPILVLEEAVADPRKRGMLVAIFNDRDPENCRLLKEEIARVEGIGGLRYPPAVHNLEVGQTLVTALEGKQLMPSLVFIDPWGYKGLTLRLIRSVTKDWGCDCIFFFNYTRINMGLANPAMNESVNALFGEDRASALRGAIVHLEAFDREMAIVNEVALALRDVGGKYVLPFCFKNAEGVRTSHHLVFVSKHVRGYEIMKEIMAGYSSGSVQGVPSFQYSPASSPKYQLLFDLARPLHDLEAMLLGHFRGRTLAMVEVYSEHHVGKPYNKRNYKAVPAKMEAEGKIGVQPPAAKRPRRSGQPTFADEVRVSFA